ncbi:MAG: RHS repeat-associated core domain-containing protein [Terracidiphilus sp.]
MTASAVCQNEYAQSRSRSTGKERDTESGNDYFDARYYSSAMGRFMSPDWSAQEEPVPYAKLDDPQSLNLYAYVENNPLYRADPDGHCCWDEVTDFMNSASNAYLSDQGAGRMAPDASSSGAGIAGAISGHVLSLAQSGLEAVVGTAAIVGGGGEAVVTSPAALTGVGAVVPGAGVAVAVAGTALDVHAAATGATAVSNIVAMAMKPGSAGGPGAGKKTTPAQREKIRKENGGKCAVDGCNNQAEHVDHAIPRSQNGDTTDANLQGMCAHHNCQKGAKTSAEYQEWLKKNGQK